MKTFKAYLTEDVNPGYEGMAGEHNIDDAEIKAKLNAILGHTASMEFINPKAAVAQMEAKLSLLGLSHDGNINDIDMSESGEFEISFSRYGNTTAATIPLILSDYESKLKKEDKIIFAAFGAGFTWGAMYLKWGYNS